MLPREFEFASTAYSFARKQSVLIDRVPEMLFLKDSADKATRGEGGIVFLYGEAGIGKTRLTKEIRAHVNLRGMRILYGRCPASFQINGVPPYGLWKEVIKDYLQGCTPEQLQRVIGYYPGEINKIVPEVKQKLIIYSESPVLSPDLERERLFEAVSQLLTNISKIEPLIVVLDDLQWADQSSLLLLHYLARGVYRENLLYLGAYRDTEVEPKHPLFQFLIELNRARLPNSAQLKRLSYAEVREMVKQLLGQSDLPEEFCRKIFEKTDGNPFFIEEVISSLKEMGTIYYEQNKWISQEISEIEFPKTVKDVLKERIDRLNQECQNILVTASFIGNDFSYEALSGVTGIENDKLLSSIENILKTGMLRCRVSQGETHCSFSDVLIRDVLYEDVNPLRRRKLHHDMAYALEKTYEKKIDDHLGELAMHFLEGGEKERAFNYFLRAGDKAKGIYANNEACTYYKTALNFARENNISPGTVVQLLEGLGDVYELLGEHENCLNSWSEALLLRSPSVEENRAARLHRKIAKVLWSKMGSIQKAEKHQAQAQKILENKPQSVELSILTADMARMYFRAGEMTKAAQLGETALKIASSINNYEAMSNSAITLGALFNIQGNSNEAIKYLKEALETALYHNCLENAVYAYDNLGFMLQRTNEKEKRMDYYQKGLELAKKIGAISAQSWIGNNLSDMLIAMGNVNDALQMKDESVTTDRKTGNLVNLTLSLTAQARFYQMLGNWAECEKRLDEASSISQKITDLPATGFTQLAVAAFDIERGEYAKAKESLDAAHEYIKKMGARFLLISITDLLCVVLIETEELAEAEERINEQYKLAQELGDREQTAYTHGLRARLFLKQRKWNEAIRYFEKCLQELDVLDAKRWNAYQYAKRGLYEFSKVYTERKEEGDSQKAIVLLNQALEIFQKFDAKRDIEKVKCTLAKNQQPEQTELEGENAKKISTGSAKLDSLLLGGIPANYAVVLTSPACDERDALIKDYLETGARNGEITFYVSTEPTFTKDLGEKYPSNFYLFLCNPQAENVVRKKENTFFIKGVESLTDIDISLTQAIRKVSSTQNIRRICLNIISDVLLQRHAIQTRKWLMEVITMLKSKGFTVLSIIEPGMHSTEELYAILGLFDGEINMRQTETDNGLATFLRIKRLRNQEYLKKEEPFTMSPIQR